MLQGARLRRVRARSRGDRDVPVLRRGPVTAAAAAAAGGRLLERRGDRPRAVEEVGVGNNSKLKTGPAGGGAYLCESFSSPWSTVRRGPGAGRENCAPLNLMASSSSWRRSSASAILLSRSLAVSGFLALRSRSRANNRASMGFRATTSSSLDSSRGGLRGGYASRRAGDRYDAHVCCAAATARRRRGGTGLPSGRAAPTGEGSPETVRGRVSGGAMACACIVLLCLHAFSCLGAAGAAIASAVSQRTAPAPVGHGRFSVRLRRWL